MSDTTFYYFVKAIGWLTPIVYIVGLCIALWAFLRCRKCGYLVIVAYFALVLFWLMAWPPIDRVIRAHRPPDYSAETQQKINAAVQEAIHKVLAEEGHPARVSARRTIHFPFGPILLVVGLWLVARGEKDRPNTALEATADSASDLPKSGGSAKSQTGGASAFGR